MEAPERAVDAIDKMVERVNCFKIDPQFTQWVEERRVSVPDFTLDDEQILRRLMVLIAYSNNANAKQVTRLVEGEVFKSIIQKYFVEKTVELTAESIIIACWPDIKAIRFKKKVDAWLRCAGCLLSIRGRYGSFMRYLKSVGLPHPIKSERDIRAFWDGFNQIRSYFLELDFPYFGNFTSLCHLLMDLHFDCAKPDLIVMKAAVNLGIVPPPPKQRNSEKIRIHPEEDLKQAVKTIQAYSVCRNTRAPVIDLYFLIHGRQSGVTELVDAAYYP